MSLSKYQQDALLVLRARLDTRHPGFRASNDVRNALDKIAPYLDTWVLPLLAVAGGDRPGSFERDRLAEDANRVRKLMGDRTSG